MINGAKTGAIARRPSARRAPASPADRPGRSSLRADRPTPEATAPSRTASVHGAQPQEASLSKT